MTPAKIGNASHRFVTTLSILSEMVSLSFLSFLSQHSFITEEINTYRSFVIILSASSSNVSSNARICSDTSGTLVNCVLILSSFSSSLIAKKRFCSSLTSLPSKSAVSRMIRSACFENSCAPIAALFFCARDTAFCAAF